MARTESEFVIETVSIVRAHFQRIPCQASTEVAAAVKQSNPEALRKLVSEFEHVWHEYRGKMQASDWRYYGNLVGTSAAIAEQIYKSVFMPFNHLIAVAAWVGCEKYSDRRLQKLLIDIVDSGPLVFVSPGSPFRNYVQQLVGQAVAQRLLINATFGDLMAEWVRGSSATSGFVRSTQVQMSTPQFDKLTNQVLSKLVGSLSQEKWRVATETRAFLAGLSQRSPQSFAKLVHYIRQHCVEWQYISTQQKQAILAQLAGQLQTAPAVVEDIYSNIIDLLAYITGDIVGSMGLSCKKSVPILVEVARSSYTGVLYRDFGFHECRSFLELAYAELVVERILRERGGELVARLLQ